METCGHGARHLLHGIASRTGRLRLARGLLDFSADGMFHIPIPRTPVTELVTTPHEKTRLTRSHGMSSPARNHVIDEKP